MVEISTFLNKTKDSRILVLGDSMIDAYQWGSIERMSPEAPIPVVDVQTKDERLGGAANVALNLKSLEAQVEIISLIGNDASGERMKRLFEQNGLSSRGLITAKGRKTTIKTRIIVDDKHVLRVDEEDKHDFLESEKILDILKKIHQESPLDVLIFQDYNKGLLTPETISKTTHFCKESGIKLIVDPKKKNFLTFKNVDVFKPNLKEIIEGLGEKCDPSKNEELEIICQNLNTKIEADTIFLTLSEYGVALYQKDKSLYRQPAFKRNIVDVSGAGDTVVSVAALALAQNLERPQMAWIANLAGGLVCEHLGVVPIQKEWLLNHKK